MRYFIMRDGREIPVEVVESQGGYTVTLDGRAFSVLSDQVMPGLYGLIVDGVSFEASVYSPEADVYNVHLWDGMRRIDLLSPIALALRSQGGAAGGHGLTVKAPMPGKVVRVLVRPGQSVAKGEGLVVVEAMKMQNELQAQAAGVVLEVRAREGDTVEGGAELVLLEPPPDAG